MFIKSQLRFGNVGFHEKRRETKVSKVKMRKGELKLKGGERDFIRKSFRMLKFAPRKMKLREFVCRDYSIVFLQKNTFPRNDTILEKRCETLIFVMRSLEDICSLKNLIFHKYQFCCIEIIL